MADKQIINHNQVFDREHKLAGKMIYHANGCQWQLWEVTTQRNRMNAPPHTWLFYECYLQLVHIETCIIDNNDAVVTEYLHPMLRCFAKNL